MNESFTIPVTFQGKDYELEAHFQRWGYTHRFTVLIGEETITFEPDEEGNYRALGNMPAPTDTFQTGLIRATAETLSKLSLS